MNDKWLEFAIRIQSIAQQGLHYGNDKFDLQRYEELRTIAAEMISVKTDISLEKVYDLFSNETGYQTPKIDTRGVIFVDDKIVLVEENGTWSLPGGWCDVDQSLSSNVEKEVLEETGFTVECDKVIAIQDWRKHNVTNHAYGIFKIFVLCNYISGEFVESIETTKIGYFDKNSLPENLAIEKTTKEKILMCIDFYENNKTVTIFD